MCDEALEHYIRTSNEGLVVVDSKSNTRIIDLVELLTDSLVALAPIALYPKAGAFCIVVSPMLTFFYLGLLELCKSFLDPFGNDGFPDQNVRIDVLMNEVNFASTRWLKAGAVTPAAEGPK